MDNTPEGKNLAKPYYPMDPQLTPLGHSRSIGEAVFFFFSPSSSYFSLDFCLQYVSSQFNRNCNIALAACNSSLRSCWLVVKSNFLDQNFILMHFLCQDKYSQRQYYSNVSTPFLNVEAFCPKSEEPPSMGIYTNYYESTP